MGHGVFGEQLMWLLPFGYLGIVSWGFWIVRKLLTAASATPGPRPAHHRPRSFADLRTGPLEGRTFASLQQFAVAAVVEGGYSVPTIARLFRIAQWRLQQWVEEAASNPTVGGSRR